MAEKDKMAEKSKYLPTHIIESHYIPCGVDCFDGMEMRFYTDEKSIFSDFIIPASKHGWDNLVHGGMTSTILDEVMAWAAVYFTAQLVFTKTMTIDYLNPIHVETQIRAKSWIETIRNPREAVMSSDIYDLKGELCARGTGIYKLFPIKLARRLNLLTEKSLKRFERFIDACQHEEVD
ncbi:MAG: PaaI family thioesterase [Victivallales bacterium]|nr:PaaI family thioesterase [Victivallales bacterium]